MRRPLLACLAGVVLAAALLAAPTAGAAAKSRLAVVSFAGSALPGLEPPSDAVKPGGTYGSCYVDRLERLYAFVRFSGMRAKAKASVAWSLDGEQVYVDRFKWDLGAKGRAGFFIHAGGEVMPDGRYTVEVRVAGKLLARASVTRVSLYC